MYVFWLLQSVVYYKWISHQSQFCCHINYATLYAVISKLAIFLSVFVVTRTAHECCLYSVCDSVGEHSTPVGSDQSEEGSLEVNLADSCILTPDSSTNVSLRYVCTVNYVFSGCFDEDTPGVMCLSYMETLSLNLDGHKRGVIVKHVNEGHPN